MWLRRRSETKLGMCGLMRDCKLNLSYIARREVMLIENSNRDGIIMPVNQSPAPKHDNYGAPPYTVFPNLLDVSLSYHYCLNFLKI